MLLLLRRRWGRGALDGGRRGALGGGAGTQRPHPRRSWPPGEPRGGATGFQIACLANLFESDQKSCLRPNIPKSSIYKYAKPRLEIHVLELGYLDQFISDS